MLVRSAASAPAERGAEALDVLGDLVAAAEQRGGVREVEPVRRGDVLDEVLALAAHGQEVEDPAAVVVEQDDRQLAPRGLDQAAEVMDQGDVADEEHDGTVCDRGDPEGGRDGPVDAVRAAVGEHARRLLAGGEERLDVAHRHRGGDHHGRLGRQRRAELGRHARLAEAGGRERAGDRRGGGAVGAVPALEPGAVALLELDAPRAWRAGRRRGSWPRRRRGPATRSRGRTRPAAPRPCRAARRAAASRSAGRRRAARAAARAGPPTRGRAAARRSARSRPGRGGRRTAGRPAAGSPRARRTPASAGPSAGSRSARPATSTACGRASSSARSPSTTACGGSPAARGRVTHGRPPARPLSSSGSGPSGTSGSRSAKFRCTGPGRPPTAVQNARHASWRSQRSRSGVAGCESTSRNHLAALP